MTGLQVMVKFFSWSNEMIDIRFNHNKLCCVKLIVLKIGIDVLPWMFFLSELDFNLFHRKNKQLNLFRYIFFIHFSWKKSTWRYLHRAILSIHEHNLEHRNLVHLRGSYLLTTSTSLRRKGIPQMFVTPGYCILWKNYWAKW